MPGGVLLPGQEGAGTHSPRPRKSPHRTGGRPCQAEASGVGSTLSGSWGAPQTFQGSSPGGGEATPAQLSTQPRSRPAPPAWGGHCNPHTVTGRAEAAAALSPRALWSSPEKGSQAGQGRGRRQSWPREATLTRDHRVLLRRNTRANQRQIAEP